MSVSTPMHPLVRLGHQPHAIDRRKYGRPRFALYWANRRTFLKPGLVVWTGRRHVRVLPLPRRAR